MHPYLQLRKTSCDYFFNILQFDSLFFLTSLTINIYPRQFQEDKTPQVCFWEVQGGLIAEAAEGKVCQGGQASL